MSVARVKTSTGWVDLNTVGPKGDPGAAGGGVYVGTTAPDPGIKQLWVDTDEPPPVVTTSLLTALPSSPVNGQEIRFQSAAMATEGIVWTLRYNGGSSSAYKWEYVGGTELHIQDDVVRTVVSATAATVGGAVCSLTLPLAGDYRATCYTLCDLQANTHLYTYFHPSAGSDQLIGLLRGGLSPGTRFDASSARTVHAPACIAGVCSILNAGDGTNTAHIWMRSLQMVPVRVG